MAKKGKEKAGASASGTSSKTAATKAPAAKAPAKKASAKKAAPPEDDLLIFTTDKKKKGEPSAAEDGPPEPPKPTAKQIIGGQSWTGKLPVNLLSEHCQKMKWERPDYHQVRDTPAGVSSRESCPMWDVIPCRLSQDGVLVRLHTPQWKNQQLLGGLSHRVIHRI